MVRSDLKSFFAAMLAAIAFTAPAAAQTPRPNPFKTEPQPAESAAKITPFASKFKDLPLVSTSKPLEWRLVPGGPPEFDVRARPLALGSTPPWRLVPGGPPEFDSPATKSPRVMDAKALPASRTLVLTWAEGFPALGEDFEVLAASTATAKDCIAKAGTDKAIPGTYNCIAHTAGIRNLWVNPYKTAAGWDMYYGPLGYVRLVTPDTGHEPGFQKVAVYAKVSREGRVTEYAHASLQEDDGTWTSKLGSGPLIRHRTADSVSGPEYGDVVRVYVRKKPQPVTGDPKKPDGEKKPGAQYTGKVASVDTKANTITIVGKGDNERVVEMTRIRPVADRA